MKGAEKIFIYGEEIAKEKSLQQERQDRINDIGNVQFQAQQYTDRKISEIPEVDPQKWVDSGFNYTYEDPNYVSPVSITVEPFGDSYGFDLGDDGYYVNNNSMIDQSYAMCKIVINNSSDTDQMLNLKVNQQSEKVYDFGMFSLLNTDLVANVEEINTNVAISFQHQTGDIDYNVSVPAGESYITVKYKKDGSESQQTDTFKFKLNSSSVVTETRHMATEENVDDKIKQAISVVYKYKGSVANEASLPTTNVEIGDVYNCEDTGNNFAWDGTKWDSLAGIVDMSNYYTKEQANANATSIANARAAAIADEKIAAIPVNNLLHYKGHVETLEELPSTGQPSGEIGGNPLNLNKTYTDTFNLKPSADTKRYESALNSRYTGSNYFIGYIDDYASYRTRGMLCTNYPETIKGFGIVNNILFVYVTPTESKPVYARNQSGMRNEYYNTTPITYDDGTYYSAYYAWVTVTKPGWIQVGEQNTNGSNTLYGNLPQILKYIIPPETLACQSSTAPEYYVLRTYTKNSSTVHLDANYVYNDGYEIIKFNEDGSSSFVFAETTTELNDTYTVGSNYDIYRRNEKPAWEHWSQAPESSGGLTKAYVELTTKVNSGGVGTDLNTTDKTNLLNLAKELVNNPVDVIEVTIPNLETKVQATYKVTYMKEMAMYDFYIAGSDHNNFFVSISASLYEDVSTIEMSWAMASYTQPATMDSFIYNDFTQQINVDAFAWSDKTIFIPEDSFEYSCEGDFEYTYDSGIFKTEELSYTEDQHGSLTITITQDFYNPDGNIMLKAWQDDTYQGFGVNDGNVLLNDEPLEEYQHQGYYILPNLVAGDVIKLVNTYNQNTFDTPIAAAICYTRWTKDEEGTKEGFDQNLNSACYSIYSMNINSKNNKKPLLVIDVPKEPNYNEKLCTATFLDYVVNNNHWVCKSAPVNVEDFLVEYTFEFDYTDGVIENLNLSSNKLSTGGASTGSSTITIDAVYESHKNTANGIDNVTIEAAALEALTNYINTNNTGLIQLDIADTDGGALYKVPAIVGTYTDGINIYGTIEFSLIINNSKKSFASSYDVLTTTSLMCEASS